MAAGINLVLKGAGASRRKSYLKALPRSTTQHPKKIFLSFEFAILPEKTGFA
jgi:hypothetical protein